MILLTCSLTSNKSMLRVQSPEQSCWIIQLSEIFSCISPIAGEAARKLLDEIATALDKVVPYLNFYLYFHIDGFVVALYLYPVVCL